jgi:nicotinamide mononucleotide transporter
MHLVLQWIYEHYLEILGFVFGILGVFLTAKQNIWCWPVGLANVILCLFVFLFAKLYADVILQIFYLVMTIYGWYEWLHGGEKKTVLKIRRIRIHETLILLAIGAAGTAVAGYLFSRYTDAALPYWDSLVAVWGVIGTWAMARKILEHWVMWIIVDLICSILYAYKEIYLFSALYFVFVILAVYGLIRWKKDFTAQTSSAVLQ